MVDLFGKWVPFTNLDMGGAVATNLPQVIVNNDDILEIFELDADGRIPFNILDDLCNKNWYRHHFSFDEPDRFRKHLQGPRVDALMP